MRFGVLGPVEVQTDLGVPVRVPELKVRALLALLLAADGEVVPADRLVDELWPTRRPADPRTALQARVSQLRRALDDAESGARDLVVSQAPGYALRPEPEAVDAARVVDVLRRARAETDPGASARLLDDALALWRGAAFADAADLPALAPAVARLDVLRLEVAEQRAEAHLASTRPPPAGLVGELEGLVAAHPLRERARAALVRALYRAGRPHEALDALRDLRARLREELGTDPAPELVELERAVLSHDPALRPAETPQASDDVPPLPPLPSPLTPLVGRGALLARVADALATNRLVTLVGTGGVGKTRVAVAAARAAAPRHAGGACFVELDGLPGGADADEVAAVVATGFAVRTERSGAGPRDPIERLVGALTGREALLVLDNVEHVAAVTGAVTARLLAAAPGLRVLATGREPLGLPGEQLVAVDPLATDGADAPAVALFLARAREADPALDDEQPPDPAVLGAICARLDGIPLAVELAAARVRALGLEGLREALDDRLALLGRRAGHGVPARHRTLRAAIDWSWELLDDDERAAVRRLAPCVGGCILATARRLLEGVDVGADPVEVVVRLVERSWLTASGSGSGRRYRMLESVRDYAVERLAASGGERAARDRHLDAQLALAEEADAGLRGREQRAWLARLDAEGADVRAALDHAVAAGHADAGLRLVEAMVWFWFLRGRIDVAVRAADRALAAAGPAPGDDRDDRRDGVEGVDRRATVRTWRTALRQWADHPTPVPADGSPAADGIPLRAQWFRRLSRWSLDDPAHDAAEYRRLLAAFRAAGDRWGAAAALSGRAEAALLVDDLDAARADAERAAAVFVELGDRWGELQAAHTLGVAAATRGEHDEAHRRLTDALTIATDLGLAAEIVGMHGTLGRLALVTGDLDAATHRHDVALALARDQGHPGLIEYASFGLALARRRRGDLAGAEELLVPWLDHRERDADGAMFSLPLAELGYIAEQRGDAATALARHGGAYEVAVGSGSPRAVALALEGLAGARGLLGEHDVAAGLLGAAGALRARVGAPLGPGEVADVTRLRQRLLAALGPEAADAAEARGAALGEGAVDDLARGHAGSEDR